MAHLSWCKVITIKWFHWRYIDFLIKIIGLETREANFCLFSQKTADIFFHFFEQEEICQSGDKNVKEKNRNEISFCCEEGKRSLFFGLKHEERERKRKIERLTHSLREQKEPPFLDQNAATWEYTDCVQGESKPRKLSPSSSSSSQRPPTSFLSPSSSGQKREKERNCRRNRFFNT